jgi:N-acetylmuramic acid 6-phosphate etherase
MAESGLIQPAALSMPFCIPTCQARGSILTNIGVSDTARQRSEAFLKIADQFRLGALVTEAAHPATLRLSEAAQENPADALRMLFAADADVIRKFREFAGSGRAEEIAAIVLATLQNGGRIFFTGCGATGRLSILLDSIWRDFWRRHGHAGWEDRMFSVMAGGDFALIKSVEGFEDFTAFGQKQMRDVGVSSRDVVFAITEGGETPFVIGTAWAGVEAGAKVFFAYNNPDHVLCAHVQRSREVIQEPRIDKINLTTGPMAVSGSTRMQATSIQLSVMLTILEMVARGLVGPDQTPGGAGATVPQQFLAQLEQLHATLQSPELCAALARLAVLESSVYRAGGKCNYFAGRFGLDVLTDTTERSPTFCTPPFRKFDDATAAESWAFLFLPQAETTAAWENMLQRPPRCLEWDEQEMRGLITAEQWPSVRETLRKISRAELMRFKIGQDGLPHRRLNPGDAALAVVAETEKKLLCAPEGFFYRQLEAARDNGAKAGIVYFGHAEFAVPNAGWEKLLVPLPATNFLLDGISRVAVKLVLNALSTCVMARLGRVWGNTMVWVVPSNLKLIDRATRYIARLAGLPYAQANALLFEVLEYVEPRLKAGQSHPPVVALAVRRAREKLTNAEAEARWTQAMQGAAADER